MKVSLASLEVETRKSWICINHNRLQSAQASKKFLSIGQGGFTALFGNVLIDKNILGLFGVAH